MYPVLYHCQSIVCHQLDSVHCNLSTERERERDDTMTLSTPRACFLPLVGRTSAFKVDDLP
jgi:hypothetical protein